MSSLADRLKGRKYQLIGFFVVLSAIALLTFDVYMIYGLFLKKNENLVALLFLRRDNIEKTLRGEIFPIARYLDGKYEDASVMAFESQRTKEMVERSILNRLRDFSVYHDGRHVGSMSVKNLEWGLFQCLHGVVGVGDLKLDTEPDFSRGISAHASYADGREFSYSLAWYPALTGRFRSNFKLRVDFPDKEKALTTLAQKEFLKHGISLPPDTKPTEIQIFDLDRDRVPEVMARFEVPEKGATAYLLMGARLKSKESPELLLSLFSKEAEGSWGKGYTFIDVVDVNDDGIAEVLIRFGGWEVVEFLIFELKGNSLRQVFRGAQYGC